MDCHHYTTEPAERRRDSTFGWKTEELSKSLSNRDSVFVPLQGRSAALRPPLRMSCGEAHRLVGATRGKLPVTPPSWEKLSTEQTGHSATDNRKWKSAVTSPTGWSGRCGNTSGLWMLAVDMPNDITYSSRLRWSALVRFTIWSGTGTFPSDQQNCPMH